MNQENTSYKSGFVTLIGRPNVGKSTLMNHLIGQKIAITSNKPQTTRNRIQTVLTTEEGQIVFLDTPGIHKAKNKLGDYMVGVAKRTMEEVDVILWLVEPTDYIGAGEQAILDKLRTTNTPVILVINKTDILDPEELEYVDAVTYLYSGIGYEVLSFSATTSDDEPVSRLLAMAAGKISLIAGNSGVGKSTIINRLIPGLDLRTGDVSATHHTGMHTTTFSEMHPLPSGGYLIDTPGVKGFGTVDFGDDVAHYFREICARSRDCKYGNCTHTHEPGCAVREAVEQHEISESRYASYLSILSDKEEGKYRKPF